MYFMCIGCIFWMNFSLVWGRGVLLLYSPTDISNDCAFSQHLRYDVTFGMGMSDTITLLLRTLAEVDYECQVDIFTEKSRNIYLLVVIRYPNSIINNCALNPDAFTLYEKDRTCSRVCDLKEQSNYYSTYFTISVMEKLSFRFINNCSINSEINANMYEVTATSARLKGKRKCHSANETTCIMGNVDYCFTSGVRCDGIKNCGASDWFDERKADCGLPLEILGFSPIFSVCGAVLCALLGAVHLVRKCLVPPTTSFFIFNANEDNRLCVNSIIKPPDKRCPFEDSPSLTVSQE